MRAGTRTNWAADLKQYVKFIAYICYVCDVIRSV